MINILLKWISTWNFAGSLILVNIVVITRQREQGGRGYFRYTPLAENFLKIPPLEILGRAAILFFKWEINVKIYLNLTRFRSN